MILRNKIYILFFSTIFSVVASAQDTSGIFYKIYFNNSKHQYEDFISFVKSENFFSQTDLIGLNIDAGKEYLINYFIAHKKRKYVYGADYLDRKKSYEAVFLNPISAYDLFGNKFIVGVNPFESMLREKFGVIEGLLDWDKKSENAYRIYDSLRSTTFTYPKEKMILQVEYFISQFENDTLLDQLFGKNKVDVQHIVTEVKLQILELQNLPYQELYYQYLDEKFNSSTNVFILNPEYNFLLFAQSRNYQIYLEKKSFSKRKLSKMTHLLLNAGFKTSLI